ncbi:uncharacterized protein LOC133817631 [Humulus lupulus]|uniref:uncharacterized protein LOC133817631 n=1 Tax=Humulus lupulus TaxID=3486 RepID=UPI002B4166E0|nr:uncharacterized protein LOC133817631 [Humulus lupulus]
MKFFNFSELGSCCRAAPPPEETTSVRVTTNSGRHVPSSKRRRCNSAAHWRPALHAISEDQSIINQQKIQNQNKSSSKAGPGSGPGPRPIPKVRRGDTSPNDSRRNSVPVIIPAFSPTPFVF